MPGLKSYTNIDSILENNGRNRGLRWKNDIKKFLNLNQIPVVPPLKPTVELHLYSPDGNEKLASMIGSTHEVVDDELFIDYAAELNTINIQRGNFKIVNNVYHNVIGNAAIPMLTIKEISPDRQELQVVIRPDVDGLSAQQRVNIISLYLESYLDAYDAELCLNFGENNLYKILGHKEWINQDDLVLRLYEPLAADVQLNDLCFIVEEVCDPIIDDVTLNLEVPAEEPNILLGPNFEIESDYTLITETDFNTWNDLLGSNISTSQKVLNSYFSGSLSGIKLGIDYSGFQNFINYSSAKERVDNFIYKLQLIEYYDGKLKELSLASGSNAGTFQNNETKFTKNKNNIIGEFDSFENYLYSESTSSLTTAGEEGGYIGAQHYRIASFPKYLENGSYKLHHSTSSIAQSWTDGVSATASLYDSENDNSLITTIPEHIRLDANNSAYELFVNMIGQHFDILWTYIDALTRIYKLEEQPKLSIDKSILPEIAKSMGWELANGKQATQLWQYKLGTNSIGALAQSGSIFSESDEEITGEVWRRIVNNLPYLLKTKGTSRSIKALMNIYGIPQTLLSIREYGGPKVSEDTPAIIEDRFSYAIQFNSGSNVNYSSNYVSSSIPSIDWGINRNGAVIPPITREFRFKPYAKADMKLLSVAELFNSTEPIPKVHLAVEHTSSYSGSTNFGRLTLIYGKEGTSTPVSASTNWVPIYNGNFWNVRYYYETTGDHFNTGSNTNTTYRVQVQDASDFINGKVNFSSSLSITPDFNSHFKYWSHSGSSQTETVYFIGGITASNTLSPSLIDEHGVEAGLTHAFNHSVDLYSGSMQEYREWNELIDKNKFDRHTLNPTSYVSTLSPSSSYDTLIRQYTFGSNTIGVNLSTDGTIISSSHPNQKVKDFSLSGNSTSNAIALGFNAPNTETRGNFIPVEETYYIEGVSSGMNSAKSQKIRFENNTLVQNLSPTSTSEISTFDHASLDTNKLGLFYSFADQVNKDIFNQVGDVALDDYIGDPEDEFQNDYPLLNQLSHGYWKKFTNTSDINSYIRIFSQYDFALFHQIKQLLAERIDEATGLLIEPHALERNKQLITKRPSVERPMYDMILPEISPTASMDYNPVRDAVITHPITINNELLTTHLFNVRTTSTGSFKTELDVQVTEPRPSKIFKEIVYHFNGDNIGSLIKRNQSHAISESIGRYYSKSLKDAGYMDDEFAKEQAIRYLGSQLVGAGINIDTTIAALNNRPVIEVFETNPNRVIYTRQPEPVQNTRILNPGNIIIR